MECTEVLTWILDPLSTKSEGEIKNLSLRKQSMRIHLNEDV